MRDCVAAVFGVLLFTASVICEDCVTFDFEDGIDGHFINHGICEGLDTWVEGTYSSLSMESPHPKSTYFITPNTTLSCIQSFSFEMSPTGVLEVNVFVKSTEPFDQISVLVHEIVVGGNDGMVGNSIYSPSLPGFVEGWHTIKLTTILQSNFNGYITFIGMAAPNSVVLIDSFRYLFPLNNEDLCQIYEDKEITPTTESVTTSEVDFGSTTEENVGSTTETDVWSTTVEGVGSTTETEVWSTTETYVWSTTETGVWSTTETDVWSTTETDVWSTTEEGVGSTTETEVWSTTEADIASTTEVGVGSTTVTDLESTNDPFPTTDRTIPEGNTTEKPDDEIPNDDGGFWTPLTITLITLLILIVIIIIVYVFFRI